MCDIKHILLFCFVAVTFGCVAGQRPESDASMPHTVYDDTVYCFNGRSIVHSGGLAGCIDADGREIIPPIWDSLEFLSNDIIMLFRSGLAVLATKDGRVLSESAAPEELEVEAESRFSRMQIADIIYWDGVLDRLDSLCNLCLAQPRQSDVGNSKIMKEADNIRRILQFPEGKMNETQLARLAEIENKFILLRK